MDITFIQCGGTIDKDYPKKPNGYEFEIRAPAVKQILADMKPSLECEVIELLRKDSMDLTAEDRAALVKACRESSSDRVIVTHGTDTMLETAKVLSEAVQDKVVILTGGACACPIRGLRCRVQYRHSARRSKRARPRRLRCDEWPNLSLGSVRP